MSETAVSIDGQEVREAAAVLRALLAEIATGQLVAGPGLVRRIEGASAAFESLTRASVR